MGGRKYAPGHPKYEEQQAKLKADSEKKAREANEEREDAINWYIDVLGFPKPAAQALYDKQTLTDTEILSKLTDKQVDTIYEAVRKRGGAGSSDPIPVWPSSA